MHKIILGAASALGGAAAFCLWQNNALEISAYSIQSSKLPKGAEGLRIAQLSDLHNKWFGKEQVRLVNALKKADPDLIVVTGDLIDKRRTKPEGYEAALCLVRQAVKIAPVYFVSGNHEWQGWLYRPLVAALRRCGVVVLDDGETAVSGIPGLCILGLADPAAFPGGCGANEQYAQRIKRHLLYQKLRRLCAPHTADYKILISHRPSLLDLYVRADIDLAFCGHAHGGQIRMPLVGPLVAPDQGWMPTYTEGVQICKQTQMVVSRGLGNSLFPQRVFNRPELVVVTLSRHGRSK